MKRYFVCYSTGEYSSYHPEYYESETKLSEKEVENKSIEIGDSILKWFYDLPQRPYKSEYNSSPSTERYDENGEGVWTFHLSDIFSKRFEEWLSTKGYKKLDLSGPEVNISYSDIPCSKGMKRADD